MTPLGPSSALLAAVATVLLLAGCSGARASDGAWPAPTVSLAPYTPPATPPPPMPVTTVDRASAVDAVLAFFDTLNYGYAQADADPLRTVSALGCSACVGWIQEIQEMQDAGAHQEGGWVRVVGMTATAQAGDQFAFRASLLREPGQVVGGPSPGPVTAGGKGELVDLAVAPRASTVTGGVTWVVVALELAPMGEPTASPTP